MNNKGKRAIFFYNRISGSAKIGRYAHKILNIFRGAGYSITAETINFSRPADVSLFEGRGDLDLVVVAGGDGTVNHMVNEMKARGVKAALAVIPAGTANDFAMALGMNRNPLKAAHQIAYGAEERVDCGYVNGLFFVNIFSFGIFTTTSQRTSTRHKNKYGRFAYIIQAIRDLKSLHSIDLTVITDEKTIKVNSLMMLVLNGATAGGFRLVHNSNVSDGMLDCLILENRSLFFASIAMFRVLFGGDPSAVTRIRARNIQVLSPDNELTDADGERGVDFPLNIECLHGELRIVSPILKSLPTKH